MNGARDVLQAVVSAVDASEPGPGLDQIRAMIAEAGVTPDMHVGDDPESFQGNDRKTIEWFLGQFADIIDTQSWFAMNSLLNCAHAHLRTAA